jgi:hypothetical protein
MFGTGARVEGRRDVPAGHVLMMYTDVERGVEALVVGRLGYHFQNVNRRGESSRRGWEDRPAKRTRTHSELGETERAAVAVAPQSF